MGCGTGRRGVGVPLVREQAYVVSSGCGYPAGRSHRRRAGDEESVRVWRGECGLVLGTVSRGRKWVKTVQCCSESWDESA